LVKSTIDELALLLTSEMGKPISQSYNEIKGSHGRIDFFSKHADIERLKDNLKILEIEEALLNGRILESYTDTGRGASVLVVGFSDAGKPIHIVCGERNGCLIVITVYVPSAPKFINPFQRGEP
jgi:hypothetical protein